MADGRFHPELVEVAREALFALETDGTIASWNRGAEEAYSFPRSEAIGHSLVGLTVPEREVPMVAEMIAAARGGRVVRGRSVRHTKHGALVHVDVTMEPTTTLGGQTYIAVSELDITRIVERDGLETKLEEVRRLKSEFLANMSHELRTPLNSIIGFAELMHKGKTGPLAPDHVEFLGDIITSSRRLLQLVNDVLDLAKLESGKIDFHPIPVDLAVLVGEVRDILKGQIAEKNLKVDVILEIETVTLDPTRLKQVLYALLSNAVKYTPERGKIAIHAKPATTTTWSLVVADSGIGVSADDLPKLFVEFPAITGGVHRGTGLGLALAQRIVEGQRGHIDCASTLGEGSTFTVTLPRAMEHRHGR
ncbi:MAG TPA: histidine kinase dimerization/phospho-acceptor domain-containing protein [Kofleriaceae bacterium]